jgi:hypothetical protein
VLTDIMKGPSHGDKYTHEKPEREDLKDEINRFG